MTAILDENDRMRALVNDLRKLGRETEWLEFKVNDAEPEEVGEYLSAITNSACLLGRETGHLEEACGLHPIFRLRFM